MQRFWLAEPSDASSRLANAPGQGAQVPPQLGFDLNISQPFQAPSAVPHAWRLDGRLGCKARGPGRHVAPALEGKTTTGGISMNRKTPMGLEYIWPNYSDLTRRQLKRRLKVLK